MSVCCNTDASPHFLSFVQSPHYTCVYLICIWIISQTSAWLWRALMNENCRHCKETHSFAPEQLAAAAVCLSDLWQFTTHIHQQSLVLLCIYRHKTTCDCETPTPPTPHTPSSLCRVVDPSQPSVALGSGFGCSLWVVGFCGSGIWPCWVISLHLLSRRLLLLSPSLLLSFPSLSLSILHID